MDDDIPPLLPPDQMPPVRSQADLFRHWRALMGPLGFSRARLWLSFFDADGRMAPLVTTVEDVPPVPDDLTLGNLMKILDDVLQSHVCGGSVAILLSRPGSARMTDTDRAWGRGLTAAAAAAGVRMHPVHLANDEDLCIFAPDDLTEPRTA